MPRDDIPKIASIDQDVIPEEIDKAVNGSKRARSYESCASVNFFSYNQHNLVEGSDAFIQSCPGERTHRLAERRL